MPSTISSPKRCVPIEQLSHASFSSFGEVIENPTSSSTSREELRLVTANQGSAKRWFEISRLTDFYNLAPSKKLARPSLSLARCQPRELRGLEATTTNNTEPEQKVFDIKILERHPFTSQTFIPIGLSAEDSTTRFLIIVAPTLPVSKSREDLKDRPKPYPTPEQKPKRSLLDVFSRAHPSPFTNERSPPSPNAPGAAVDKPKGAGMPDLDSIRVFLASGDQAVTYGAGTWHAPMVVVGERPVEFVVLQNMNGVDIEDCQEVELKSDGDEGLSALLPTMSAMTAAPRSKL